MYARQPSHRLAARQQSMDVISAQALRPNVQPSIRRQRSACAPSSWADDNGADAADQLQISCSPAIGLVTAALAAALLTWGGAADAAGLVIREEPANALSLPTWAIHVSSVIEWIAAMGLVWRYAEVTGGSNGLPLCLCPTNACNPTTLHQLVLRVSHAICDGSDTTSMRAAARPGPMWIDPPDGAGRPAWKGLTWGMVPLLGGAFSACVYHFFYNSPQLDALVALQVRRTTLCVEAKHSTCFAGCNAEWHEGGLAGDDAACGLSTANVSVSAGMNQTRRKLY